MKYTAPLHLSCRFSVIPLKKKMISKGYEFVSETDTEVLAHLLDYYYKGNPLEAITKVLSDGGFTVLSAD